MNNQRITQATKEYQLNQRRDAQARVELNLSKIILAWKISKKSKRCLC